MSKAQILNKEQLKVESFFYEKLIFTTFAEAKTLIKELGNDYSIDKVDANGHFNISKGGQVIAKFGSIGLEFL